MADGIKIDELPSAVGVVDSGLLHIQVAGEDQNVTKLILLEDTNNAIEVVADRVTVLEDQVLVIAIDELSDVDTTTSSAVFGQVLTWNTFNWVPLDLPDPVDSTAFAQLSSTQSLTGVNTFTQNIIGDLTGNADTASSTPLLDSLGTYVWSNRLPNDLLLGNQTSFVRAADGYPSYGSCTAIRSYYGDTGGGMYEMYVPYGIGSGGSHPKIRWGNYTDSTTNTWNGWYDFSLLEVDQTFTGVNTFTQTVNADSTTEATSLTTGSIVTSGGLAVAKNLHVNGNRVRTEISTTTNTRLGVLAGNSIGSGGINNTTFGYDSLSSTISDDNNSAFGFNALKLAIGDRNTAFGSGALDKCTTSTNNIAMGFNACNSVTTGAGYNSGIGVGALSNITTGSFNIGIGDSTNASASNAVSQYMIGTGAVGTENNQITIGDGSNRIRNEWDTDAVWTQSSDIRRKMNINPSVLGLDFINALNTVTYTLKPACDLPEEWGIDKDAHINTTKVIHGLVAQDVLTAIQDDGVDPDTFSGWSEDNQGQRISKEAMVIPLIKAVQELTAKNDNMMQLIQELSSKVEALEVK
jgi:hypothetical protein